MIHRQRLEPLAGTRPIFWLHLKKAAGSSARKVLAPIYRETDRTVRPGCFIQSPVEEWNDILNNYRVPLGDHTFRRAAFAKAFLFENWDELLRFAFVREPIDRCVSMFRYLIESGPNGWRLRWLQVLKRPVLTRRSQFDAFLDSIQMVRSGDSPWQPLPLHFSTHTAAVWPDVTDEDGTLLIDRLYRMEAFDLALSELAEELSVALPPLEGRANVTQIRRGYEPTGAQRRRIEGLFERDFELFESARR